MRKSSHVQYDIEYHIVWTTEYRYKVLHGKISERVRELIRQSCNSMNVTIIKGSIGKEHIHGKLFAEFIVIEVSTTIKKKNIKSASI